MVPEERIQVKIKLDTKPLKIKTKITAYKKPKDGKLISFKIDIKHDPEVKPLAVYLNPGYPNVSKYLDRGTLRPEIMKSDETLEEDNPMFWQKEIPYHTRDEAIADVISAYEGCFTRLSKGQINHFDLKYKSKKRSSSEIIKVRENTINLETMTFFPRRLKNNKKFRVRQRDIKKLKEGVNGNFIIQKIKPGYWYFCLPRVKEKPIYESSVYKSVFLDPGVRTFQTLYSPDGICGKIKCSSKIRKLDDRHAKLWSISDQKETSKKTKKNLRKRCAKIRKKMKNIIDNLHWQTCSFLCKTFDNIFLPIFKVSEMVQGSPLGRKITHQMLELNHGLFRERIKYYAKTKHRNLYIVTEEYTTKTCGHCGQIQDMEGKKIYKCSHCGSVIDRDYNGARNICLKVVSSLV